MVEAAFQGKRMRGFSELKPCKVGSTPAPVVVRPVVAVGAANAEAGAVSIKS